MGRVEAVQRVEAVVGHVGPHVGPQGAAVVDANRKGICHFYTIGLYI